MRHSKPIQRASELFVYYLELRTIRRQKVAELDERKEKIARLSTLCIDVKLLAGKTLATIHDMKVKLFSLLREDDSSEYKQEKCVKLQRMVYDLDREYYKLQKLQHSIKKKCEIDSKAAIIEEKHIVKIDKGLLFIEEDMRALVEPKKKSSKFMMKKMEFFQRKKKVVPMYFKSSLSQCSLTSATNAASEYSISLGGTLLKQWLGPLIQANA